VNVDERDANGRTALHWAATNGHVEMLQVLVELGADKDAKNAKGFTPLHTAAVKGHVEAIKALVQLGAQIDAQSASGETSLQLTVRVGHHQAAQVLRELERAARTQKAAATSERTQQAAEHANRMAAQLIEEEEREQAAKVEAQSKVRSVELAPVCGVSDAVSLAHEWVASSEVPAAAFLWGVESLIAWCARGVGHLEGKGEGQRWSGWQGGCGGEQRRGEHVAWGGQWPQHATISKRWPPHHGGGCSAGRAAFRRGRERCAATCRRRQEGERAPA
jgi:hypothetical protein